MSIRSGILQVAGAKRAVAMHEVVVPRQAVRSTPRFLKCAARCATSHTAKVTEAGTLLRRRHVRVQLVNGRARTTGHRLAKLLANLFVY